MSEELTAIANDLDSFVHDMREDGNDASALWLEQSASALRRLAAAGEQKPVAWIDFADNGNVRLWTSEKRRADAEAALGRKLTPVYAAPQPAPGWDEAIEAAKSEILRLTKEWGKPTGSHGQQAIKAHGDRLYLAVEALRRSSQSTSDAGGGVRETAARAACKAKGVNPDCLHQNYDDEPIDHTDSRGRTFHYGWRNQLHIVDAILDVLSNPASADSNASAGARLREYDPGFVECVATGRSCVHEAIGPNREQQCIYCGSPMYPHASDCEKQGWLAKDVEAATKRVAEWKPSDRPADVKCEACFGTGRHMGRFSTNDPDCTYCRGKGKVRP